MSRILILYMPTARQKMLSFPPLGPAVIGGYLRRAGNDVRIRDLEFEYWDRNRFSGSLMSALAERLPLKYNNPKRIFRNTVAVESYLDGGECHAEMERIFLEWEEYLKQDLAGTEYAGFSIMSADQMIVSLCFAKYLKIKYGLKTVLGGSFISDDAAGVMERYAHIDYVILGAGQEPLRELLSGKDKENIDNIVFRHRDDIVSNNISRDIDLSDDEPDFDYADFGKYALVGGVPVIPFESSKGCRNSCRFCTTHEKGVILKDTGAVVSQLRSLKEKYGCSNILFVDNAINVSRENSVQLAEKIIESGLDIKWSAYFIPEQEDREYFSLLKKSGCVQLRWGIETASQDLLKKMNKKIDVDAVCDSMGYAADAGIWNHLLFIIGYPGEHMADISLTEKFILKNGDKFRSAVLSPFVLGRVDLKIGRDQFTSPGSDNGIIQEKEMHGIRYRRFLDRKFMLKHRLLRAALKAAGIKFTGNFSSRKKELYKDQFIFSVFREKSSAG